MAEVKPPPPPGASQSSNAGIVVGAVAGIVVAVLVSIVLVLPQLGLNTTNGHAPCRTAHVVAAADLGGLIVLGVAAWYAVARMRGGGFGRSFVQAFLVAGAIMMVLPWPCSLAGMAFLNFTQCFG